MAAHSFIPQLKNLSPQPFCFSVHQIYTYSMFLKKLRSIHLPPGLLVSDYVFHSFRRVRASFAFQAGIPVQIIKILGD